MKRRYFAVLAIPLIGIGAALGADLAPLAARLAPAAVPGTAAVGDARQALQDARRQQRAARARGERLEQLAARSTSSSQQAQSGAAALAARIQQAEAGIAAASAELVLIERQRRAVAAGLARERAPLVRLTGALHAMTRRPLALAALQPGSLRDLVYTRAVLDSAIPRVQTMTADLRNELDRARALEREAGEAVAAIRANRTQLARRRAALVELAQRERQAAQRIGSNAIRERSRALALAEQARDLDTLIGNLEQAGDLRQQLAALPGPIPRPRNPQAARMAGPAPEPVPSATALPAGYQLPVTGSIVGGFRERQDSGARQSGIVMAPLPRAQVVAPGAGRIAFAGPYRGYGQIVIIEHQGGWTSLVTGLARLDTQVGAVVASGSPLGLAASRTPRIALELRNDGAPVNPLDHAR